MNKIPKYKVGDRIYWPREPGIMAVIDRVDLNKRKYYYTFIEHSTKQWVGTINDYNIDLLEEEQIKIDKAINYNSVWETLNG